MMNLSVGTRRAMGFLISLLCASALSLQALGQTIGTEAQEQVCRETVNKFEESMAFIRKSIGYEKAAEMKEALLPNKLESELFAKEGYCGVARHLRAKKLVGKV